MDWRVFHQIARVYMDVLVERATDGEGTNGHDMHRLRARFLQSICEGLYFTIEVARFWDEVLERVVPPFENPNKFQATLLLSEFKEEDFYRNYRIFCTISSHLRCYTTHNRCKRQTVEIDDIFHEITKSERRYIGSFIPQIWTQCIKDKHMLRERSIKTEQNRLDEKDIRAYILWSFGVLESTNAPRVPRPEISYIIPTGDSTPLSPITPGFGVTRRNFDLFEIISPIWKVNKTVQKDTIEHFLRWLRMEDDKIEFQIEGAFYTDHDLVVIRSKELPVLLVVPRHVLSVALRDLNVGYWVACHSDQTITFVTNGSKKPVPLQWDYFCCDDEQGTGHLESDWSSDSEEFSFGPSPPNQLRRRVGSAFWKAGTGFKFLFYLIWFATAFSGAEQQYSFDSFLSTTGVGPHAPSKRMWLEGHYMPCNPALGVACRYESMPNAPPSLPKAIFLDCTVGPFNLPTIRTTNVGAAFGEFCDKNHLTQPKIEFVEPQHEPNSNYLYFVPKEGMVRWLNRDDNPEASIVYNSRAEPENVISKFSECMDVAGYLSSDVSEPRSLSMGEMVFIDLDRNYNVIETSKLCVVDSVDPKLNTATCLGYHKWSYSVNAKAINIPHYFEPHNINRKVRALGRDETQAEMVLTAMGETEATVKEALGALAENAESVANVDLYKIRWNKKNCNYVMGPGDDAPVVCIAPGVARMMKEAFIRNGSLVCEEFEIRDVLTPLYHGTITPLYHGTIIDSSLPETSTERAPEMSTERDPEMRTRMPPEMSTERVQESGDWNLHLRVMTALGCLFLIVFRCMMREGTDQLRKLESAADDENDHAVRPASVQDRNRHWETLEKAQAELAKHDKFPTAVIAGIASLLGSRDHDVSISFMWVFKGVEIRHFTLLLWELTDPKDIFKVPELFKILKFKGMGNDCRGGVDIADYKSIPVILKAAKNLDNTNQGFYKVIENILEKECFWHIRNPNRWGESLSSNPSSFGNIPSSSSFASYKQDIELVTPSRNNTTLRVYGGRSFLEIAAQSGVMAYFPSSGNVASESYVNSPHDLRLVVDANELLLWGGPTFSLMTANVPKMIPTKLTGTTSKILRKLGQFHEDSTTHPNDNARQKVYLTMGDQICAYRKDLVELHAEITLMLKGIDQWKAALSYTPFSSFERIVQWPLAVLKQEWTSFSQYSPPVQSGAECERKEKEFLKYFCGIRLKEAKKTVHSFRAKGRTNTKISAHMQTLAQIKFWTDAESLLDSPQISEEDPNHPTFVPTIKDTFDNLTDAELRPFQDYLTNLQSFDDQWDVHMGELPKDFGMLYDLAWYATAAGTAAYAISWVVDLFRTKPAVVKYPYSPQQLKEDLSQVKSWERGTIRDVIENSRACVEHTKRQYDNIVSLVRTEINLELFEPLMRSAAEDALPTWMKVNLQNRKVGTLWTVFLNSFFNRLKKQNGSHRVNFCHAPSTCKSNDAAFKLNFRMNDNAVCINVPSQQDQQVCVCEGVITGDCKLVDFEKEIRGIVTECVQKSASYELEKETNGLDNEIQSLALEFKKARKIIEKHIKGIDLWQMWCAPYNFFHFEPITVTCIRKVLRSAISMLALPQPSYKHIAVPVRQRFLQRGTYNHLKLCKKIDSPDVILRSCGTYESHCEIAAYMDSEELQFVHTISVVNTLKQTAFYIRGKACGLELFPKVIQSLFLMRESFSEPLLYHEDTNENSAPVLDSSSVMRPKTYNYMDIKYDLCKRVDESLIKKSVDLVQQSIPLECKFCNFLKGKSSISELLGELGDDMDESMCRYVREALQNVPRKIPTITL